MLLKTGTEWNGMEHTRIYRNEAEGRRNETKWTRIVLEYSKTSWNDPAMKRNDTSVTPE